jgi:hypothetical protein
MAAEHYISAMALILLSIASILFGTVMMRSGLGEPLAWIAILAGVVSLFAHVAVVMGIPLVISLAGVILSAVWQLIAGFKLFKSGGKA